MGHIDTDQAYRQLQAADRAHRTVTAEIGLPRAYWWAMGAGVLGLSALAAFTPVWVASVATVVFGAGHAALASRLLGGRHRSHRVAVARSVAGRWIPLIVIGILAVAVAVTVGLAFALAADGTGYPGLWAGGIVGMLLGLGGPEIFDRLRKVVSA